MSGQSVAANMGAKSLAKAPMMLTDGAKEEIGEGGMRQLEESIRV